MAAFSLGDIQITSDSTRGPLGSLSGTEFATTTLRYPKDLGSTDKGHYMVIYIKKQSSLSGETSVGSTAGVPLASTSSVNLLNQTQSLGSGIVSSVVNSVPVVKETVGVVQGFNNGFVSGVSNLLNTIFGSSNFSSSGLSSGGGGFVNTSAQSEKIINRSIKQKQGSSAFLDSVRKTQLTTDAIALYMPDTLLFQYNQSYDEMKPGNSIAGQVGTAIEDYINNPQGSQAAAALGGLGSAAGIAAIQAVQEKTKAGKFLANQDVAKVAAYKAIGGVLNPMLELIYQSPRFREFQFDFTFYPRDEKEALNVQNIIERLRYHQAPDLPTLNGASSSAILIPPSEFDIKFYYGGSQNPNLDTIGTCVLTGINVNYAPNGFQAYELPTNSNPTLGGTGMPVAINLQLNFRETVILTKKDFDSTTSMQSGTSINDPYGFAQ
jgi:hypothetical protein